MERALLRIEQLTKQFGGLVAVDQLSLEVNPSDILGVIGPNGAGKSTLMGLISGLIEPTTGKVFFKDHEITGLKAHQIAQRGIGRNFQASDILFMDLSVMDNVFSAYHLGYKTRIWKRVFRMSEALKEEAELKMKALALIEFMGLGPMKDELAKNLPHGSQRILGMCLALATEPQLLLLDEPVTGMNQTEIAIMIDLIRQIRDRGMTIIIIEHNIETIMSLCDRIIVINYGKKIAEGLPTEIQENEEVIEAYLGKA